jgi:S-adenosylmethionine:tRNA ribosyltransferase-isomerase
MKLSAFKFNLPPKLIASHPVENRDESRLMVVHKSTGKIEHKIFKNIIDYFHDGDTLVINNTKIFPAKLYGSKDKTGAQIEVFLLRQLDSGEQHLWDTLVEPARKIRVGNKLYFGNGELVAEVLDNTTSRGRTLKFLFNKSNEDFYDAIDQLGFVPIPDELKRKAVLSDKERYQTIYAEKLGGSVPSIAGLHFTPQILKRLALQNVNIVPITMHISFNSLQAFDVEDLTKHKTGSEEFIVTKEAAQVINKSLDNKSQVCAIGALTAKALETTVTVSGRLKPAQDWSNKLIFPPYNFKICTSLVTNFHLPQTLPLINAAAFSGYELMMEAYQVAIKEKYRFFVYGDAMLII